MTFHVALLPGDGIGPEVTDATVTALRSLAKATGIGFTFEELPIGVSALKALGDPLPLETVEKAKQADGILLAATDAAAIPPDKRSPLSGLRRALNTYASIRPSYSHPGVTAIHDSVDLVVVRETTEGVYSKIEYPVGSDAVCTVRVVTRHGTERVARRAFELAQARRGELVATHKLAGIPVGDSFWLEVISAVAEEFPDVSFKTANIDAAAHEIVMNPSSFDVILAENQNGDVLSDVAAAVSGGLPLAPSGCYGDTWSYFEPVHGSAPDIAGKEIANPTGMMLASAMLLDHLGESEGADRLTRAIRKALADDSKRTRDLGGTGSTADFTRAVSDGISEE